MIYTNDGRLNIDNNAVENSIRPVAIEKIIYLQKATRQRSAMLYSLMGACKL
jgi:transposase